MGSFKLGVAGRNLLMEGGGDRGIVDGKGGNKDERLVEIIVVTQWRNETRWIDAVQWEWERMPWSVLVGEFRPFLTVGTVPVKLLPEPLQNFCVFPSLSPSLLLGWRLR